MVPNVTCAKARGTRKSGNKLYKSLNNANHNEHRGLVGSRKGQHPFHAFAE